MRVVMFVQTITFYPTNRIVAPGLRHGILEYVADLVVPRAGSEPSQVQWPITVDVTRLQGGTICEEDRDHLGIPKWGG